MRHLLIMASIAAFALAVFATGIVVGDPHAGGLLGGDLPHHRSLACIAPATAAKDHVQLPFGQLAQRAQGSPQGIPGVGVVDKTL